MIIETLTKVKDAETTIYTLAAAKKHVIEENLKNGVMIPQKMIEELTILALGYGIILEIALIIVTLRDIKEKK